MWTYGGIHTYTWFGTMNLRLLVESLRVARIIKYQDFLVKKIKIESIFCQNHYYLRVITVEKWVKIMQQTTMHSKLRFAQIAVFMSLCLTMGNGFVWIWLNLCNFSRNPTGESLINPQSQCNQKSSQQQAEIILLREPAADVSQTSRCEEGERPDSNIVRRRNRLVIRHNSKLIEKWRQFHYWFIASRWRFGKSNFYFHIYISIGLLILMIFLTDLIEV